MDIKLIKWIIGGTVSLGTLTLATLGIVKVKNKHLDLITEDLILMDKQVNEAIESLINSVSTVEVEPATKTSDGIFMTGPNDVTSTRSAQIYNSISEYLSTNIEVVKRFSEGRTLLNDVRILHATLASYGIDHSNAVTATAEK